MDLTSNTNRRKISRIQPGGALSVVVASTSKGRVGTSEVEQGADVKVTFGVGSLTELVAFASNSV